MSKLKFKKEEELIFDCGNNLFVKGTFISNDGPIIKIKITSSDYSFEKPGDEATINVKYLTNIK